MMSFSISGCSSETFRPLTFLTTFSPSCEGSSFCALAAKLRMESKVRNDGG